MLSLNHIVQQIEEYSRGAISIQEFEDWFEGNCSAAYYDPSLKRICVALDAAFSQYHFDHTGEAALKEQLANAIRPYSGAWSDALQRVARISVSKSTAVNNAPTIYSIVLDGYAKQVHLKTHRNTSKPPQLAEAVA